MDLFFVKISCDVTKKTAKRGFEKKEARPARNVCRKLVLGKKEARPARNVRRKLVLPYLSTRPT
jgi:hypothetical protein